MKVKKIIKISIIVIFIVIFAAIVTVYIIARPFLGKHGILEPTEKKIESIFYKNKDDFNTVKDYFQNFQDFARWDQLEPNVIDRENVKQEINDRMVSKAIEKLKDNDLEVIDKYPDHILFCLWQSLDSSSGLIYCSSEPDSKNIFAIGKVELKEISPDGWYYFYHLGD